MSSTLLSAQSMPLTQLLRMPLVVTLFIIIVVIIIIIVVEKENSHELGTGAEGDRERES